VVLISDAEVQADRAFAVSQLTDRCRIERFPAIDAGDAVFNETTGQYDPPTNPLADDPVVIYEGPCRWQIRADINTNVVEPQELEREWAYQTSTLQLPVEGSGGIRTNDVVTCTDAHYDPTLVGRVFNIQAAQHKSMASTRRFRVREAIR
jgi:hypothetical protein